MTLPPTINHYLHFSHQMPTKYSAHMKAGKGQKKMFVPQKVIFILYTKKKNTQCQVIKMANLFTTT